MNNIFKQVENTRPKKNVFDLTHDVKLTAQFGKLIPTLTMEAVPGDKFIIGADMLVRFAPMLSPIMHRVDVTMHYFFVPNRILWENWEQFITLNAVHDMPYIEFAPLSYSADEVTRFVNYMGIPFADNLDQTQNEKYNALPFAAYQKIYNEYYRDQNLVPEANTILTDGDNTGNADLYVQRYRAYEHDYFTACLPFAQKGAAVDIPIGSVELNPNWGGLATAPDFKDQFGNTPTGALQSDAVGLINTGGGTNSLAYDPEGTLQVKATTINDLRRAMRLQEYLEKNARGGTRYSEWLKNHFDVNAQDSRLQRPEYITGVKSPVVTSEVLSTAGTFSAGDPSTPTSVPTGNMAGHGVSVANGNFGTYKVHEHGYIIGIMSVMPKTAYQQGIAKTFLKRDPLEIYTPSFAHIGEQEVKVKELYSNTINGEDGYGYIPRYAEYKYMPSRVCGDFAGNLEYWHLGRVFANEPSLNQTFIEMRPEYASRIFAVTDADIDNLYCHVLHKIKAVRPMPIFGTPTF